ncbi:MAG: hypothetical protein A2029_08355 [Chloroflexi bacterium RBG_19FT_COMBO_47_9]|nr:MAG: hypothetical protein A2029_08355 [Chloroflexi bacterium RBG_19FT_COMBO_47_9]
MSEEATMQPCDELKKLVLQNLEKEASGKIIEVVQSSYSHQEGALIIGSDFNHWFEGYDAIFNFYAPADGSPLNIRVETLKAFCEGTVGWTVDRVWLIQPDGNEIPIRYTRIFHQDDGALKIVHNHISIAVSE